MNELKEKNSSSESGLQIEMDLNSYVMLKKTMEDLEIPTYGELIRRSLQIYELKNSLTDGKEAEHRQGVKNISDKNIAQESTAQNSSTQGMKRIHVRLAPKTKERLDLIKSKSDSTYAETIITAIVVLAQADRNLKKLIDGDHKNDSSANPELAIMRETFAKFLA